ncbi:hypothetical protein [Campylobacter troglodytis]|uniref:hypothetical protein n=1 Tax=Campylobacter troglodytis TaxID=654363 RepID=UPI001159DAF0|nr:hypothetical protein [Campylobacter troglodytis]TQR56255.1 hypothetical protein DMC01_09225 [Campylobacter troglodytis]
MKNEEFFKKLKENFYTENRNYDDLELCLDDRNIKEFIKFCNSNIENINLNSKNSFLNDYLVTFEFSAENLNMTIKESLMRADFEKKYEIDGVKSVLQVLKEENINEDINIKELADKVYAIVEKSYVDECIKDIPYKISHIEKIQKEINKCKEQKIDYAQTYLDEVKFNNKIEELTYQKNQTISSLSTQIYDAKQREKRKTATNEYLKTEDEFFNYPQEERDKSYQKLINSQEYKNFQLMAISQNRDFYHDYEKPLEITISKLEKECSILIKAAEIFNKEYKTNLTEANEYLLNRILKQQEQINTILNKEYLPKMKSLNENYLSKNNIDLKQMPILKHLDINQNPIIQKTIQTMNKIQQTQQNTR